MAVSQIDAAAKLGNFLQIVYTDGIMRTISEDFRDWDMVTKLKAGEEAARSINFMLQTTYGAAAIQWSKQGSNASFPNAQQLDASEKSAGFNEIFTTIEMEYDLWQRALSAPHKFAEPLAQEILSKGIAQKRRLSIDYHGDGTGLIGRVKSAAVKNSTQIEIEFVDDGEGVRYCEWGDKIGCYPKTGGSTVVTLGVLAYGTVAERNREDNKVTINPFDSSDEALDSGEVATAVAAFTADSDTEYVYRSDQPTKPDLTVAVASRGEYNNLTEVMPGIETLSADDGRLIHGITMSGPVAGTTYDAGGNPLDISHLQRAMDKVKTINGNGRFKYKQALTSPEALTAFIESQETDRRLMSTSDKARGFDGFSYIHGQDRLDLMETEFVRGDRIWVVPEGSKQSGCLELHGKDFKEVKVGNQSEFLKPSASGGHAPFVRKYMFGYLTLLSKCPPAILSVRNFTTA